jgi:hypothetical protein
VRNVEANAAAVAGGPLPGGMLEKLRRHRWDDRSFYD